MIYIVLNNSIRYGGGVEQVVNKILLNLNRIEPNDVTLVCNDSREKEFFYINGFQCLNLNINIQIGFLRAIFLDRLIYSYKIFKFLRRNVKDSDKVIIEGIEYTFFTSLFRFSIKNKFLLFAHVHGSSFEEVSDLVFRLPWKFGLYKILFFFGRWYFFLIDFIAAYRVDKFIFINKNIQGFFERKYLGKRFADSLLLYNGIDVDNVDLAAQTHRPKEILIVGATSYRKGLDIAIQAVKKIGIATEVNLTIIGFEDIENLGALNTLPLNIKYIGRLRPDEIREYYKRTDLLILPSRHEGWPLVILEALANGKPVIVSQACHFNELPFYDELGLIIKSYNPQVWGTAIVEMLYPETYKKYTHAISKYRENLLMFSWKKIAADFETFVLA